MTLYHGSTVSVQSPAVIVTDIGRDFGPAFYTTGVREQAERWAVRRALLRRKSGEAQVVPIVSTYEFDERAARAALKVRSFAGASAEWLDMIVACRSRFSYRHGYDLVEGKVADDNVGETVSYVVAGVMSRETALERLRFQKINDQIAFCTSDALKYLSFVGSFVVEGCR